MNCVLQGGFLLFFLSKLQTPLSVFIVDRSKYIREKKIHYVQTFIMSSDWSQFLFSFPPIFKLEKI